MTESGGGSLFITLNTNSSTTVPISTIREIGCIFAPAEPCERTKPNWQRNTTDAFELPSIFRFSPRRALSATAARSPLPRLGKCLTIEGQELSGHLIWCLPLVGFNGKCMSAEH